MKIITAMLNSKLPNRLLRTLVFSLLCAGFALQFPLSPAIAEKIPAEILAGVHRNFPPQYSLDEQTGQPVGFAIDIMDEVARRAGLKIRYVIFDEWPPIMKALKEGRIDIIPNMGVVEERNADMDFTVPIEAFDISIFVRETTTNIRDIEDLRGRNVAAVRGCMGLFIIQKYGRAKPVICNSLDQALLSLLSGNADALVYPGPPLLHIVRKSQLAERIKTVGKPLLEIKRAIAVGKGKTDLLHKLDTALKELIPTPEYKRIYAQWYGAPEPYWNTRRVLIPAGIILVLVIVIFAGWHYLSLRHLNRDLQYALEERKKAEEVIRENAARLKVALTPIDMAVFNQDLELRYTWMYQPQRGYTSEQVVGKNDAELLPPDAARRTTEIKRMVLENGTGARGEVEIAWEDRTLYYDLIVEPLCNATGQVVGITGASLDVTDRKQAEEKIKAALREKETMLMEIYHRVKNNMQVISSMLSLQSSYLQDEKAREALQNSIDRVKTMADIHNLLYNSGDLARIDLAGLIKDLTGRLQQSYSVAESPVDVQVDTSDVSLTIETAIPCGLILNELVTNALKHAFPKGKGGKITIAIRSEDNQVVLTVQDNGVGLPDAVDFQHPQSLGLELVNLLVGQINGKINVQVDGGTTFTVIFPVNKKGG
ncbi:MAG: transporter substrate-binding domain-containing protein [Syntrophales bacterium]